MALHGSGGVNMASPSRSRKQRLELSVDDAISSVGDFGLAQKFQILLVRFRCK
jgi:hypothetical protein